MESTDQELEGRKKVKEVVSVSAFRGPDTVTHVLWPHPYSHPVWYRSRYSNFARSKEADTESLRTTTKLLRGGRSKGPQQKFFPPNNSPTDHYWIREPILSPIFSATVSAVPKYQLAHIVPWAPSLTIPFLLLHNQPLAKCSWSHLQNDSTIRLSPLVTFLGHSTVISHLQVPLSPGWTKKCVSGVEGRLRESRELQKCLSILITF